MSFLYGEKRRIPVVTGYTLCIIVSVVFLLLPCCVNAFHLTGQTETGTLHIRSQYRGTVQGEVVKISLTSPLFTSAWVHFQGQTYPFVPECDGSAFFVLLGLGLEEVTGIKECEVHITFSDGTRKYSFKIPVSKKKVSVKKLRVHRKFVSPSKKDLKRIRREEELLRTLYAAHTPRWHGRGRFVVPASGAVRKNFGEKRLFNDRACSTHRGVDICARGGYAVAAANSGTIVLSRSLYFAGNTVIIDHGIGLFSFYCHLLKRYVKEGETVTKGRKIGRVGETGRVTGPHLHWGVTLNGEKVDPLSLLSLSFR